MFWNDVKHISQVRHNNHFIAPIRITYSAVLMLIGGSSGKFRQVSESRLLSPNNKMIEEKKRKVDQKLESEKVKNVKQGSPADDDIHSNTKRDASFDLGPRHQRSPSVSPTSAVNFEKRKADSLRSSPELKTVKLDTTTPDKDKLATVTSQSTIKQAVNESNVKDSKIGGQITPTDKPTGSKMESEPKQETKLVADSKLGMKITVTPETKTPATPNLESKANTADPQETTVPKQEGFWAKYTRENQLQKPSPVFSQNSIGFASSTGTSFLSKSPQKTEFTPVKTDFWAKYSKDNSTSAFSSPQKPKVDFQTLLKQSSAMGASKDETSVGDDEAQGAALEEPFKVKGDWKETETVTGEEDDDTVAVFRCRLYVSIDNEWKERGVGNLKLNALNDSFRLVMRTDAVLKVILNVRLYSKMPMNQRDKYLEFAAVEDGKLCKFLGQFRNAAKCEEALKAIKEVL